MAQNLRRLFLVCLSAASLLAANCNLAHADTLSIDLGRGALTIAIGIGWFNDTFGSNQNEDTNAYYGPGDIGDLDGVPVTFKAYATSEGQGNAAVPPANLLPGGIVPGFSDGSSAQANGTINVTPAGFTIDSAAIGLDNSGLWQPGTVSPKDVTGPPSAAQLGLYLDANALIPGEYGVVQVNGASFNLATSAALALGAGGSFTDPAALLTLNAATITGFLAGSIGRPLNETITLCFVDHADLGNVHHGWRNRNVEHSDQHQRL